MPQSPALYKALGGVCPVRVGKLALVLFTFARPARHLRCARAAPLRNEPQLKGRVGAGARCRAKQPKGSCSRKQRPDLVGFMASCEASRGVQACRAKRRVQTSGGAARGHATAGANWACTAQKGPES